MKNSSSQIAFQNLVLLSLAILPVNQFLAQGVCIADFTFQINCGVVTFTDQSTIPNTPSWQWTFPGGNPPNSSAQNPVVTFPGCDTYDVCLTVTGTGAGTLCSESICHSVTIVDNTPPVALCFGISAVLDANCTFTVTPGLIEGGSSDDCQIQSMSVSPSILTGCGFFPVTLTVTDWCGNTSTCTTMVQTFEDVPPVIACPPHVTVTATTPPPCSAVVNGLLTTSVSDNCSTPTVSYEITGATVDSGQNDASGTTFNQGVSTVTYTAVDDCGNIDMCSFRVTVVCDTLDFPGVHCGQAVVTCFSGFNSPANYWSGVNLNAPVMALIDVRDHSTATPGTMWTQASATEYFHPTWTPQNMGQVFGIAIDKNEDIFVAASTIYTCNTTSPIVYNPFTAAGPGAIYKVDGATAAISNYITTGAFSPGGTFIPNNGSALGDIGYDATNDQFFVTNHADGMIYRIKSGQVMSRFDPFGSINPPASGLGSNPDFVARGERTWGVAYYNNRVYFATWKEDIGRSISSAANEIWSIGLNSLGEFQATTGTLSTAWADGEVLEITIPTLPASTFSNPVSDIAFSTDGKMLLAERTMESDCGGAFSTSWYGYAHSSRLLEYVFNTSSIWDLTPGHTIPITASNVNLKFRTGATNSGSNSAGGCDYGYASFDPSTVSQPDCDQFVWNTGDNLHPPTSYNTFCSQNGITWLYGMQGMSASGGTNLNSLLVDFDNNACTHDKILVGDVEILKCGCIVHDPDFPCDSLWVTKKPVIFDPGTMPDTCCWDIDFHIHAGPLAYMEVESLTPGVVFNNTTLSSSFQWGGTPTGTLLPISYASPGHGIPPGDYNDALTFCLGNILTPAQDTQCVVFRWYVFGPTDIPYLACADTCYFFCPPPVFGDSCAVIKNDSIACNPENPLEYCYFFQVQNLSDFNASQVVLSNPTPGFAFKPCPPPNINITSQTIALPNPSLNPGIEPDSCSPQLCVKIVASAPVLSPTMFCFEVGLSSNDSCCHSSVQYCIILEPCCDPCEDKGVVVHTLPPLDSCCHSLDITNDCEYFFFTKLELELLTPGVIFGSLFTGGPFPADWFNPISTNTLIQWQHISGSIPSGTTPGLINFCLDEIDQPSETPQVVVLNWLTTGSDGRDSIACSDTLIFDCPVVDHKCVEVLEQSIKCEEDENGNVYYALMMTIQNVSTPPHTANELIFNQIGGPLVTLFPNPVLFSPLPFGGMTTINTFIFGSGLNVGDKLTFEIRLHDSFTGDNWCCFEGDTVCVFIPPCDSCCTDYDLFCQNVMNAVFVSIDSVLCKATVNIGNLPDCDYLEGINWGDGSFSSGPFISGDMPMHTYTASVSAIISYLAIELDSNGVICFEKQLSDTITLNCTDLCPNNLVPNPSFETFITCPVGLAPPFTAASWTLPTGGSADYYNSCASGGSGVSTPGNTFGSQAPRTGAGYAGFILRSVTTDYREYIEVPLSSPLINGSTYQISFYVSLSDASQDAIDKIGAYLSVGSVGPITSASVLPYVPQVINPSGNYITDKSGWTLITGTFVGGGESHIVIGNFNDDSSTIPVTGLGGFYAGSYYYIDDVCVALISPPDSCVCGAFSDMFIRWAHGAPSQPVSCGGAPVVLGCPQSGDSYNFTGVFHCNGDVCPDNSPVTWTLTGPGGSHSGTTQAIPYFGITLLPTYFVQPGLYTLTITGQCGNQSCPCVIQFIVDCPDPCPCSLQDIQALAASVNQGFAQVLSTISCKACFSPIALSDCETVEWYLTNTGGTPIGTSTGNQTFCYTFPGSGTYTVIMVATRKKADGSNCETFTKSQTVTVTCLIWADCADSVIDNPTFSDGAVAGGLNSGGMSRGWNAFSGEPVVIEGENGSTDGWTIQLSGNLDAADVLSRMEAICLEKGTGVFITTVKGSKSNSDNRLLPGGIIKVQLYQGDNFNLNECNGINCFELASVSLSSLDTGEWHQLQIPYDLSNWLAPDSCGDLNGVLVRPAVYLTNALGSNQGGADTYSFAQLDNFCISGTLVAVDDPLRGQSIRIYPNPNTGEFTVDLSALTVVGTSIRIISLTGQLLSEKKIENNGPIQNVDASLLPEGMYIIQIISEGRVTAVSKFVKM